MVARNLRAQLSMVTLITMKLQIVFPAPTALFTLIHRQMTFCARNLHVNIANTVKIMHVNC